MKYIIVVLCLLTFSGCTLIGLSIGDSQSDQAVSVEKLEPGDDVRIYQKDDTELEGKFVFYDANFYSTDKIQVTVDSEPRSAIGDTLEIPMDRILYLEKSGGLPPGLFIAIGIMLDIVVIRAMVNNINFGVGLNFGN